MSLIEIFEEHCSTAEKETLRLLRLILNNQEIQMSTPPVTRDQLDAAIDTLVSTVNQGFTDLLAKIAAGTVTTPEDFSAEVAKLQALTTTAVSADPGPPAPSTPPATT